jgi:hypothetical protein
VIDDLRGAIRLGLAETAGVALLLLLLWELGGRAFDVFGMIGLSAAIVIAANLLMKVREPAVGEPGDSGLDEPVLGRPFGRFQALRELVRGTAVAGDQFEVALHPLIVEIADFRLARRHGVDRERQPVRARALLGEKLWSFVNEPPSTDAAGKVDASALEAVIGELEAI